MSTAERKALLFIEKKELKRIDEAAGNDGVKKYIFEGPCAVFDKKNENDRYYKFEDYHKHAQALQQEINDGSLLGEMDHPDGDEYLTSMKRASHVIRKLWFDDSTGMYMIRIELLNTADGKNAMAIADAGSPLFISSRATGYIDDDGNVTLEKIYTYDVVYKPGFAIAKMRRVSESLNLTRFDAYEMTEQINNTNKNQFAMPENDSLKTVIEMEKRLRRVEESIKRGDNEGIVEYLNMLFEDHKKLIGYSERIANKTNSVVEKHSNLIGAIREMGSIVAKQSQDINNLIGFSNLLSKRLNETINYAETIGKVVNESISYSEMIAKVMNENIAYGELIAKTVNENIGYSEKIGKVVNELVAYTETVVNEVANYSQNIGLTVNENIAYTETIGKIVNEHIDYTEKNIEQVAQYSQKVAQIANENFNEIEEKVYGSNKRDNNSGVKESANFKKGEYSRKIDEVLESVKKRKLDENAVIINHNYPFVKHLSPKALDIFMSMEDFKKNEISEMVRENKKMSKEQLESAIIESHQGDDGMSMIIGSMPNNYRPIWEKLSRKEKADIIALFRMKNIRTMHECQNLWYGVNLNGSVVLNESIDNGNNHNKGSFDELQLGYDTNSIDQTLGIGE